MPLDRNGKYIVTPEVIVHRTVPVDIPPEGPMDRAIREMETIWGPYPTEWRATVTQEGTHSAEG